MVWFGLVAKWEGVWISSKSSRFKFQIVRYVLLVAVASGMGSSLFFSVVIASHSIVRVLVASRFAQCAHLASTYLGLNVACLECFQLDRIELFALAHIGQPEAEQRGILVTVSGCLAFDVGRWHELFQARARRQEVLTTAFDSFSTVHDKTVAGPHVQPTVRT